MDLSTKITFTWYELQFKLFQLMLLFLVMQVHCYHAIRWSLYRFNFDSSRNLMILIEGRVYVIILWYMDGLEINFKFLNDFLHD